MKIGQALKTHNQVCLLDVDKASIFKRLPLHLQRDDFESPAKLFSSLNEDLAPLSKGSLWGDGIVRTF